jgi:hypothetical protein
MSVPLNGSGPKNTKQEQEQEQEDSCSSGDSLGSCGSPFTSRKQAVVVVVVVRSVR